MIKKIDNSAGLFLVILILAIAASLVACALFSRLIRSAWTSTYLAEIHGVRLTNLDGRLLFFVTKRHENPRNIWVMWTSWEAWTSDGTIAGTRLVKPVYTGWNEPVISPPILAGRQLYFQANGVEDQADAQSWKNAGGMWRTDGTASGTIRIEKLASEMLSVKGTLFFSLGQASSCALYQSDGTAPGTKLIKQINEDCAFRVTGGPGQLFFATAHSTANITDCTLWSSDGTERGTQPIRRFQVKPGSTCIRDMVMFGGRLVVLLTERGTTNSELWTSDGSAAGTVRTGAIHGAFIENLNFRIFHVAGPWLFFSSASTTNGSCALWVSDGTAKGTRPIKQVCLDDFSMMTVGNMLMFTVDTAQGGWELWRSDGTVAGTQLVRGGFTFGKAALRPRLLLADRGSLYLDIQDAEGCALWASDGSFAGTATIHRGCPDELINVGGTLFFILPRSISEIELWKTDGTAAGTSQVRSIP